MQQLLPLVSRSRFFGAARMNHNFFKILWHHIRWHVSSTRLLSRFVERKLDVGEFYWLFLLGSNNSGTTLLMRLLESHPLIRGLPYEGQALTNALPSAVALGCKRLWTKRIECFRWTQHSDPSRALRVKYDWSFFYPEVQGILFEKSPPNTVRALWLQEHFRPCRFIAMVRSPYAVCEGIRRRQGVSIEDAAKHWSTANQYLFKDIDSIEKVTWFRYEDFCADPQKYQDMLLGFLNLTTPFDNNMIQTVSSHSIEGNTKGVKDLNKVSIANLSAKDIITINNIAGKLMEKLGYDLLEPHIKWVNRNSR